MFNLEAAKKVLEQAVEKKEIPSAVAVVGTATERHTVAVCGVRRYGGEKVTLETGYDLASLSKVVSTLPCILRLVSDNELSFKDTVGKFITNAGWFQMPSLAEVTVQQLLTHTSGLPAWKPLFAQTSTRQTAIANVLQTELAHPKSTIIYSDLGFILLGIILERVSKLRQDDFAKRYIFEPLSMNETSYGPLEHLPVAATEDCGWRNEMLEGIVHDENAFVMEGVAGHAGLFGTANDVATYAQAWLTLDSRLGSEDVLRETIREHVSDGKLRRGLGWLLKSENSFAGKFATEKGYGHTGFTGTSIWLEPQQGLNKQGWFSVLLTNRVHPTRNHGANIHEIRQAFHNALCEGTQ
jgi:CubicO group peptidase (beta-lactamase class C family)